MFFRKDKLRMTALSLSENEKIVSNSIKNDARCAKENFFFFSSLTKFDKRWFTVMIMLESSEGGGIC